MWETCSRLGVVALLVAVSGCKTIAVEVPVAAPEVRAAADRIQGGAVQTKVTDVDGHPHPVAAESRFSGFGLPSQTGITLADIGRACSGKLVGPAGLAPCPTDDPALVAKRDAFHGPWLQTESVEPDGKAIGNGILGGLVLGALGAFVAGQVACFDSAGCGDAGRAAFVAGDILLGLVVIGGVLFLVVVASSLGHD